MTRRSTARGRTRRGALSRDGILEAALAVAQREGVDALSIRKLAGELGVTPMAVYHHVPNKQEILVGVIDRVVGEAAVTVHGVSRAQWRDWLRATFGAMYRALCAQPGVIPLLGRSLRVGPSAGAVLDEVLDVLQAAGLDRPAAARGFQALMSYTLGSAGLRDVTELVEDLAAPTASEAFAEGFEIVLAGLAR
jgi:AcrR family transcriptional regulator